MMRPCIPVLLVIAVSLYAIRPAHAEQASPQLQDELVSLTQQLMDAVGEGKSEVWKHIVADDALIVDEFGRRQTAKEIIARLRPFPPGFSGSIEIRDPRANVYGDTAVLVCEEYERESVFGQQFTVRYIATNTFTRHAGAWKLVAMEDVTLPTAPPKLAVAGLDLAEYGGTYRYAPGRAWTFAVHDGALSYMTHPGRPSIVANPIARDVFMEGEGSDERNLLIFQRDASGHVVAVIERRKFNDLKLTRWDASAGK
ncbi:MAG TPA: nuclear transport factor 2 family protein [Rhodanobacteraceae bacterium]|nr:nuclear transport factor 2 family protein [Rhodanobacteraceae bacterium]